MTKGHTCLSRGPDTGRLELCEEWTQVGCSCLGTWFPAETRPSPGPPSAPPPPGPHSAPPSPGSPSVSPGSGARLRLLGSPRAPGPPVGGELARAQQWPAEAQCPPVAPGRAGGPGEAVAAGHPAGPAGTPGCRDTHQRGGPPFLVPPHTLADLACAWPPGGPPHCAMLAFPQRLLSGSSPHLTHTTLPS